jgi:outer membrane lipoprotein-sorting protein
MRTAALTLAIAAFAAGPARAEDAKEILRKLEDRLYYPQAHGLKDLKATLAVEVPGQDGPAMPGLGFTLYWKAPDRKACRLELPEEIRNSPMAAMIEQMMGQMLGQMSAVVNLVVPERTSDRADDYDWTAGSEDGLTKITGRRRADAAKKKAQAEEMTIWVDASPKPVRMASTVDGKKNEMADLEFKEVDGKLLLSSVSMKQDGQPLSMTLEYQAVGKLHLAGAVTMEGGPGGAVVIRVKDVAVNRGVEDAVFAPPAPEGGETQ